MKNKTTAGILALFLGGLGVHRFYLGQTGLGILYLVFFWTFIPAFVALIDGIIFLTQEDSKFNEKYNPGKPLYTVTTNTTAPASRSEINPFRATHFYPTLAGFQYHNASNILEQLTPGTELELKRDPFNANDPSAVEVYFGDQKVGYLPREYANSIAKQMDNEEPFSLKVFNYDPNASDFYKLKLELIDLNYFAKIKHVIRDSDVPY